MLDFISENTNKMVNIPINVSTFPTDEIGVVTDINQNINQEYYEWLLKQHNYFPDCAFHMVSGIKQIPYECKMYSTGQRTVCRQKVSFS